MRYIRDKGLMPLRGGIDIDIRVEDKYVQSSIVVFLFFFFLEVVNIIKNHKRKVDSYHR